MGVTSGHVTTTTPSTYLLLKIFASDFISNSSLALSLFLCSHWFYKPKVHLALQTSVINWPHEMRGAFSDLKALSHINVTSLNFHLTLEICFFFRSSWVINPTSLGL